MPDPHAVDAGLAGANELLAQATSAAAGATEAAAAVNAKFAAMAQLSATAAWALLTLAFVLAIFHEHYQAQANDTRFRVWSLGLRFGATVAALLAYSRIVWLITSAAGGWGDWMGWQDLIAPVAEAGEHGIYAHSPTGIGDLGKLGGLLKYLLLYGVLVCSSLFALVATILISTAQGLLIAILLTLGKLCIAASMCPGVGMAKTWARLLAMVAAWSTIGGTAAAVIFPTQGAGALEGHAFRVAATGDIELMLTLSGKYIVFALFTLATPMITSAIFNGAMSSAPGVTAALAGAFMGARMIAKDGMGAGRAAGSKLWHGADRGVGAARRKLGIPRKVERNQLGNLGGPAPRPRGGGGGGRGGGAAGGAGGGAGGGGGGARGGGGGARGGGAAARAVPRVEGAGGPPRRGHAAPDVPAGSPGQARWNERASDDAKRALATRGARPPAQRAGVPDANLPMRARAGVHQGILRKAYPDLAFRPQELTKQERAILDELDGDHGRFSGWEHGQQGAGDFRSARRLADARVAADDAGVAQPASGYVSPADRVGPAAPIGAAGPERAATVDAAPTVRAAGAPAATVADAHDAITTPDTTRPGPSARPTRPRVHQRVVPRAATRRDDEPPASAPGEPTEVAPSPARKLSREVPS